MPVIEAFRKFCKFTGTPGLLGALVEYNSSAVGYISGSVDRKFVVFMQGGLLDTW